MGSKHASDLKVGKGTGFLSLRCYFCMVARATRLRLAGSQCFALVFRNIAGSGDPYGIADARNPDSPLAIVCHFL